jgi:uncharacterized protein (DUF885 family)
VKTYLNLFVCRRWRCAALLVSLLPATACGFFRAPAPPRPSDTPEAVATDYWEILLSEAPLTASRLGDRRFDAVLPDIGAGVRRETYHKKQELLRRLRTLNPGYLSRSSFTTAKFLASALQQEVDQEICQHELWRVSHLDGYHLQLLDLADVQVIDSGAAATAYVTRLGAIPTLFEQHTQNLRDGLRTHSVAPKVLVERVLNQLRGLRQPAGEQTQHSALEERLLLPLSRTSHLSAEEAQALREDVRGSLRTAVIPAYAAYETFLKEVYLPLAIKQVGAESRPHGAACYAQTVAHGTGVGLTAAQLHESGKNELERLQEALRELAQSQGFTAVDAYLAHLEADPRNIPSGPQAMLAFQRANIDRAVLALPQAFCAPTLPPLQVEAMRAYQDQDTGAGTYSSGSIDGRRPAIYAVNTFEPKLRPYYSMEALAFHETVPGHHLQMAYAQKNAALPAVRQNAIIPAYSEGWALYAERLADELGLYSSPAARFGMLNYAAWRAARLVVDTGLHAFNWSREQAVLFLDENTHLSDADIANEVDRYIAWPGQALAYMVGYMEIAKLRQETQRRLGSHFDLRVFHQHVLQEGPLPLPVLRDCISVWLSRQSPAPPQAP